MSLNSGQRLFFFEFFFSKDLFTSKKHRQMKMIVLYVINRTKKNQIPSWGACTLAVALGWLAKRQSHRAAITSSALKGTVHVQHVASCWWQHENKLHLETGGWFLEECRTSYMLEASKNIWSVNCPVMRKVKSFPSESSKMLLPCLYPYTQPVRGASVEAGS